MYTGSSASDSPRHLIHHRLSVISSTSPLHCWAVSPRSQASSGITGLSDPRTGLSWNILPPFWTRVGSHTLDLLAFLPRLSSSEGVPSRDGAGSYGDWGLPHCQLPVGGHVHDDTEAKLASEPVERRGTVRTSEMDDDAEE